MNHNADNEPLMREYVINETMGQLNPIWLDSLPIGLAFFDLNRRVRWANGGYANILGVAAYELEGSGFGDIAGISLNTRFCPVKESLEKNRPVSAEITIAHKPEEARRYSVNVSPVHDAAGQLLGATALLQVISDRRTIEQALQQSEMRLKEAQRLARIGSWELDLVHNQLYWSDEIFRIFDIDPTQFEATYEAFLDVVHPDDRQLVNDIYTKSIQNDSPYEVAHRLLLRDGRIRYVHERGKTFLDGDGKPIRTIGTVWDITERKQQEEENLALQKKYHQSQRLETVGRLAGGVAHDFNNMLAVILGQTDLLLDQMSPGDFGYQSLQEVQHAAERSAELIRHLLAFARRQPMKPVYLDLNEVIAGMLKMLRRLIGEHIVLDWKPSTEPAKVKMDPSQLEQIMANLCVNARDAIARVGHIAIETQSVSFDNAYCAGNPEFTVGEWVMLAVSDDGCGMDTEVQQQIFEPFFTTKHRGGGTGLGLATVFGIVKQNNGLITVSSEPGRGTTFRIFFVRHRVDIPTAESQKKKILPRGNGEVILLVEDEPMVLEVSTHILEKLNYNVLPASSPSQALEYVKKATKIKISLLMTDVVMPEMNGAELSKEIEKMLPGVQTLFTSAYTADVVFRRSVLSKGVEYLQKPVSKEALAIKIDAMLHGRD